MSLYNNFRRICAVSFMILLLPAFALAQTGYDGLLRDIPEPPGARGELPSPIPMVYEFMGAMMDGNFDVCLSNFDVDTFFKLIYGKNLARMDANDYKELFAYQVQAHRNEFKFLTKVMHRVAEGARIDYSNPRGNSKNKRQSKVVARLDTNRGRFDFEVYCYYVKGRWYVYDYVLNRQRLTRTFQDSLKGVSPDKYLIMLRPFYDERISYRPLKNEAFDFSILIPRNFDLKENVSQALLAALSGFEGRFLLHIQAATYSSPQSLSQVGAALKGTLAPFKPRLYDQWKGELAGVEIGNILFHFLMGNRRLFGHMVLIPLGKKLVVLNFYHSSLTMMKHMTNIREKMISSISLPKLEAMGGIMPGEIPGELTMNDEFGSMGEDDDSLEVNASTPESWGSDEGSSDELSVEDAPDEYNADYTSSDEDSEDEELEPDDITEEEDMDMLNDSDSDSDSDSSDESEMLTPTSYTEDYTGDETEDYTGDSVDEPENDYEPSGNDEDYIPPPPTNEYDSSDYGSSDYGSSDYGSSDYGSGDYGDSDDDYYPGDEGSEVAF